MSDTDNQLAAKLAHARWFATSLLATMAVLFIASSLLAETYTWLGVVRAFAEAALIGGLADWFAVTALFRRPFGLAIPHTAIIPTRKNEIGRALAQFVGEHFLVRGAIEKRLERAELAARFGRWLERERNAERVSRDLSIALDWFMRSVDTSELRGGLKSTLTGIAEKMPINEAIAAVVDVLASGDNAQLLIDQLIQFGRQQLEHNKATIRARIEERSPWWMPKFVDEEIYDQLVAEFERLLNEIGDDSRHPARVEFNERLRTLRLRLLDDPQLIARGAQMREEFLQHPAVREFFRLIWERTRNYLQGAFENPQSEFRLALEREIRHVGRMLAEDDAAQSKLDRWCGDIIIYIVENYRGPLSEIISDTVEDWDARSTSERIELHIGKDLQFIRINGTLVGGIVGVLLYLSWQAFL
jgi:uncharacterized membrane-anchored protein YjiN (DUF445 family)